MIHCRRLPCACFKTSPHSKLSYENMFDNEPVERIHFDMNGFARRLVLIQRQKATGKCPIKHCSVMSQLVLG